MGIGPGSHLSRVVVLLLGMAALSCSKQDKKPPAVPPPVVTASSPLQKKLQGYDEFTGRVAPVAQVTLRARVSGYLKKVNFADGDFVKQGDLLFEIETDTFEAEVNQRKAALERANAGQALARANLDRAKALVDQGVISSQEYEVLVAESQTANADVVGAQAALDSANLDLSFTKIVSPIDGRISAAELTAGNLVIAGSSAGGSALATIISQDPMYAYFDLDENKLVEIRDRRSKNVYASQRTLASRRIPVLAAMGTSNNFEFTGLLDYADWGVNSQTGTVRVRGTFANPNQRLVAGMFVRLRVLDETIREALLVPPRSIGTDQDRKFVYVLDETSSVEYRAVKLGREENGMVEIVEGLDKDDRVVIDGLLKLKPGVKPEVKPLDLAKQSPSTKQDEVESSPAGS